MGMYSIREQAAAIMQARLDGPTADRLAADLEQAGLLRSDENARLRDVLQRMSTAATDSAGEFRAIGQDAAASFAESVAKVTREALAEG